MPSALWSLRRWPALNLADGFDRDVNAVVDQRFDSLHLGAGSQEAIACRR